MSDATTLNNVALSDEIQALNSIYGDDTVTISSHRTSSLEKDLPTLTLNPLSHGGNRSPSSGIDVVLHVPDTPFSVLISFPIEYPEMRPRVVGIESTGSNGSSSSRGRGDAAVRTLRDGLDRVWVNGQVCLFDLIEEVGPTLAEDGGRPDDLEEDQNEVPDSPEQAETEDEVSFVPDWAISEPIIENKSVFVARACHVSTLSEAKASISHLLATNKKVASATHNITAWRLRIAGSSAVKQDDRRRLDGDSDGQAVIQDCDDDGETAAGGRLLHLMQLMDVWNVVVVVTRWYGGVKLGPDRFRIINTVARDVLVRGGFAKEKIHNDASGGKKNHRNKK